MCCLVVAKQEMSDALESATIEVLHVSPFQETTAGELYLELAKRHLLKHFKSYRKNSLREQPTNQAFANENKHKYFGNNCIPLNSFGSIFSFNSQNTYGTSQVRIVIFIHFH